MTENSTTPVESVAASNQQSFWYDRFKQLTENLDKETTLFYSKGKGQAGTNARKILQEIRDLLKEGREHIQSTKKLAKK